MAPLTSESGPSRCLVEPRSRVSALAERLRGDLVDWERTRRDEGTLLRGTPLTEAEALARGATRHLNPDEQYFIQESIALKTREEEQGKERQRRELNVARELAESRRQALKRLYWGIAAVGFLFVTASVLAWQAHVATLRAQEAADERTVALARLSISDNPDRAIMLIKGLPDGSRHWRAARVIAADALARGVARTVGTHEGGVTLSPLLPMGRSLPLVEMIRMWNSGALIRGKARPCCTAQRC